MTPPCLFTWIIRTLVVHHLLYIAYRVILMICIVLQLKTHVLFTVAPCYSPVGAFSGMNVCNTIHPIVVETLQTNMADPLTNKARVAGLQAFLKKCIRREILEGKKRGAFITRVLGWWVSGCFGWIGCLFGITELKGRTRLLGTGPDSAYL